MHKVIVSGEQRKIMLDTQLCNEGINGANLHAIAPACIAEHCGLDISLAAWIEEGKHPQPLNDARLIFGAIETLKEFLDDDAGCGDCVTVQKRSTQDSNGSML